MKVSLFKSLLVVAATVVLFASCSPKQESVRVGLDATAPSFANGKVDLIVALSGQSATNVGVTLTASGSIPASSLTFEKNPSIPAGTTSKTVSVTVDESTLEPGDYEATFSISSVTGADINVAKQSVTVKLTVEAPVIIPDVSIASYSDAFAEGKATLKLALSQAIDADVVVNFEVVAEMEGYDLVPAEALAFTNPVKIPAGSTSLDVEVALDETKLAGGKSYYAVIAIASVSENAKVAATKTKAYIEAVTALAAELVSSWTLSYAGREEATNGKIYDWILVEGWTGDYYDVSVFEAGTLQEDFAGDILALMEYNHSSYVGQYLGQYTIDQLLRNEATYCNFTMLDPGSYEVYLFDYRADGSMSGKYATAVFEIEEEEATDEYAAVLGQYTIATGGTTWEEIYIYPNITNYSYMVYLSEWDEDDKQYYYYPAIFDWDKESGAISAHTQKIDEWENQNYGTVEYWQYAYITMSGDEYYVTGSYDILQSEGFADGSFTVTAAKDLNLSNGGSYSITGLDLIGSLIDYVDNNGDSGYAFNYLKLPLPATFTKIADLPSDDEEEETGASVSKARIASIAAPRRPSGKTLTASMSRVSLRK